MFNDGKLLRYNSVSALISEVSLHVFEVHSRNLKEAFTIISGFDFAENLVVLGDRISFLVPKASIEKVGSILTAVKNRVDDRAELKEISASLDNIFASLIKT